MSMGLLYLFVKLDSIVMFFGAVSVVFIIITVLFMIIGGIQGTIEHDDPDWNDPEDSDTKYWKVCKKILLRFLIPVLLISTLLSIFIPTTKEIAFIYIASKVSNNEKVQKMSDKVLDIPDKALDILNNKMNEYIQDQIKDSAKQEK